MKEKGYPGLKANREYLLYVLKDEIIKRPEYDIAKLKATHASKLVKGAPFFVLM